mmetsp:Transcript_45377/g.146077  ORF Transcript_45377/g.146077 Transcript_45377/m.146077 type:complete len:178 (+) Transcript_45377:1230-1763(+)
MLLALGSLPRDLALARETLLAALPDGGGDSAKSHTLTSLFEERIAPEEPAIWESEQPAEERAESLVRLSLGLDALEAEACGPLLAGGSPTAADGLIFPSFCLYYEALPSHFGWEEWTDEALFYRRPRLHAWFELLRTETGIPVGDVERRVRGATSQLSFEWATPVPTRSRRGISGFE